MKVLYIPSDQINPLNDPPPTIVRLFGRHMVVMSKEELVILDYRETKRTAGALLLTVEPLKSFLAQEEERDE